MDRSSRRRGSGSTAATPARAVRSGATPCKPIGRHSKLFQNGKGGPVSFGSSAKNSPMFFNPSGPSMAGATASSCSARPSRRQSAAVAFEDAAITLLDHGITRASPPRRAQRRDDDVDVLEKAATNRYWPENFVPIAGNAASLAIPGTVTGDIAAPLRPQISQSQLSEA